MTIEQLLADEAAGWERFTTLLGGIPETDWRRPGINGAWTPKDLLAHVVVWHDEGARMLDLWRAEGGKPLWTDTDAFNARAYEEWHATPLETVRSAVEASRTRIRDAFATLSDPVPEVVQNVLVWNAQRHYNDHIPHIESFVSRPTEGARS
jgi:uncharacterized protein (TIGR03083 family)